LVADRSNGQRGREYLFALKQDSEGAITGVTAFGNKSIDFAPEKGKPLGQYLKTNAQGQITERGTTIMIDGKLVRNNSVMDMSNARQQLGLLQDMKGYFAVQNGRLITWDEGKKQWVRVNGGVQEFSNQKMYIVTAKDGAAPTAAGLQARQFNATAVGVILSLRVQDGKLQFDNRIDPKTADASKMFWEARRLDGDGAALSFKDISSAVFKSAGAWVGTGKDGGSKVLWDFSALGNGKTTLTPNGMGGLKVDVIKNGSNLTVKASEGTQQFTLEGRSVVATFDSNGKATSKEGWNFVSMKVSGSDKPVNLHFSSLELGAKSNSPLMNALSITGQGTVRVGAGFQVLSWSRSANQENPANQYPEKQPPRTVLSWCWLSAIPVPSLRSWRRSIESRRS
jgi:hypothetical protein